MQEQQDKAVAKQTQQAPEHRENPKTNEQLHPDRLADALLVTLAIELRRQDPCAGQSAQGAEVKDENQLIDNGHAAHRLCPHLSDHDVVEQRDKVRYHILNQDRHQDGEYPLIKIPIPDIPPHVHPQLLRYLSKHTISKTQGRMPYPALPAFHTLKGLYQSHTECQERSAVFYIVLNNHV